MKNILFLLLFALPFSTLADAWDNLTLEQANKVVSYLDENPFIYDYCDCCGSDDAFSATLLRVVSSEIVPCDWEKSMFSVKVQVIALAAFDNDGTFLDTKSPSEIEIDNYGGDSDIYESGYTIYMNYTWVYNKTLKKAAPFYSVVDYSYYGENDNTEGQCNELTEFPNPKLKSVKTVIKDRKYKKWYKKRD